MSLLLARYGLDLSDGGFFLKAALFVRSRWCRIGRSLAERPTSRYRRYLFLGHQGDDDGIILNDKASGTYCTADLWRAAQISRIFGTFETCRPTLTMSVSGGRSEVSSGRSKRRD